VIFAYIRYSFFSLLSEKKQAMRSEQNKRCPLRIARINNQYLITKNLAA